MSGGVLEDGGCFTQLNVEGALSRHDSIRGTQSCEYPVNGGETARLSWNVAALSVSAQEVWGMDEG